MESSTPVPKGKAVLRSRFSWRLYGLCAALLVVMGAAITILVQPRLERALIQRIEGSLENHAHLIEPFAFLDAFGESPSDRLQPTLTRLGETTDLRLTLIAPSGEVVADSHEDPARMENHSARPEVRAALGGRTGIDRRVSATLGHPSLYVAIPSPSESRTPTSEGGSKPGEAAVPVRGVVRVAIELSEVESAVRGLRTRVLWGASAGLVLALLLALGVARWLSAPLGALIRTAEDLRLGRYDSRVHDLPRDELGVLGATLNQLGAEITQRIELITRGDERLRAILAGMVEGVVAVDAQDRIVFCNRAARRLFGRDESDPVGRELWAWARVAGLEELLEEARGRGHSATRELVVRRGLEELQLQAHATPFAEGEKDGVVVVLHDMTELRKLEGMRSDFVANVSHELKTPLTSIRGFVETLLDGALHDPPHNERFLQKIATHVERLTHLVTDLLSLARIESQVEGVPVRNIDWWPILEQAKRTLEPAAGGRDLEIEILTPGARGRVRGDEESMRQVVDNLLDNAIKYSPDGGRIELEIGERDHSVVLSVRDEGLGIPKEDLERVFERFYRVDKARSREMGGTGLGLAIVKHLVLAMGGDVRVSSVLGQGTCFEVLLPSAD